MKIIKFRGKTLDDKKWVYGYYVEDKLGHIIFGQPNKSEGIKADRVDPKTVGQYTGLKDKTGKEIYEGDKVKRIGDFGTIQYPDRKELVDVVKFKGGCFYPVCEEPMENFEIIGNIYE